MSFLFGSTSEAQTFPGKKYKAVICYVTYVSAINVYIYKNEKHMLGNNIPYWKYSIVLYKSVPDK